MFYVQWQSETGWDFNGFEVFHADRQAKAAAACDQCHAPHSTDELHANGFTGTFLCKACHPAYRSHEKPAA